MDTELEKIIENMDQGSLEFDLLLKIDDLIINLDKEKVLGDISKTTIDGELTLFLTKQHSENELMENLNQGLSLEIEKEDVKNIIEQIKNFISPLKNINKKIETPSPAQALVNVQERLTKPSTVAPITRDYSVTRSTETPASEPVPRAPSMDIYREIPEK